MRLGADCGCSPGEHFVPLSWDTIKGFARAGDGKPAAHALAPTATVVALDQFVSFDAWRAQPSSIRASWPSASEQAWPYLARTRSRW
jgi:hypothetical protein